MTNATRIKTSRIFDQMVEESPNKEPIDFGTKTDTWGKDLLDVIAKGQSAFLSSMADWVSFASQIENTDNSSQVARRLQFSANNNANLFHNQFFGNRQPWRMTAAGKLDLDAEGNTVFMLPTETEMRSQSVRFAAKQNLDYWEDRMGKYITEATANSQTEEQYSDDLNYQTNLVRLEEARLWYGVVHAMGYWVHVMEYLTGEPYIYTPFTENRAAAQPNNTRSLAATLMSRK